MEIDELVKELRIGNKVLAALTNEIVDVSWLTFSQIGMGNYQNSHDQSPVYFPIPLTEEWLKRARFEQPLQNDRYGGWLSLSFENEYRLRIVGHSITRNYGWHGPMGFIEIKHVHRLQNLIFSLSGKELEFIP